MRVSVLPSVGAYLLGITQQAAGLALESKRECAGIRCVPGLLCTFKTHLGHPPPAMYVVTASGQTAQYPAHYAHPAQAQMCHRCVCQKMTALPWDLLHVQPSGSVRCGRAPANHGIIYTRREERWEATAV